MARKTFKTMGGGVLALIAVLSPVWHGQAQDAKLRCLFGGGIGRSIGKDNERNAARLQRAQDFDGARQQAVAAQRTVAEDQRAVEIEHESFDGPQPFLPTIAARTHAHGSTAAAGPRSSSLKPCFSIIR